MKPLFKTIDFDTKEIIILATTKINQVYRSLTHKRGFCPGRFKLVLTRVVG